MTDLLTFFGPEHHLHILNPIVEALETLGLTNAWYTANADASFETGFPQLLARPFVHLSATPPTPDVRAHYERLRTIAQGKYRDHNALSLLVPDVLDRMLYDLARERSALAQLLDETKPRAVLALHELHRWGKTLGSLAAERNLPFFTFQEGLYYGPEILYRTHCRYSRSLVWGFATKDKLIAAGNDPARIEVLGHPGIEARWAQAERAAEETRNALPPSHQNAPLALIYLPPSIPPDFAWPQIAEQCGPYRLIVYPNIASDLPSAQQLEKQLTPLADRLLYGANQHMLWLHAVLCHAVCIVGCSSFGLDCLYNSIPLAEFPIPYQPFSFSAEGLAVDASASSPAQWIPAAVEHAQTYARQRYAFVNAQILDGAAADAIAQRIRHDC